jgi:release factor glutamine methyltransferase
MSGQNKTWKILDLLKTTEELFRNKEISNPRLNAEMLLADTLKTERIKLYIDFEKPLNENELEEFRAKVRRRLNNEPIQYITGKAHFYGLEFCVNPSVLIPRPETELLVDKTLELVKLKLQDNLKILEIGTGSGCISISIAANIKCIIDAIDISAEAVNTASENANNNKLTGEVNFLLKNILNSTLNFSEYDIIISNPPYIPAGEMQQLDPQIRDYEPANALTDNSDGLEFYRCIFGLYNITEHKPAVLIEIGDGKIDAVEKLLNDYKVRNYTFHKDLLNIYRVLEF